MKRYSVRISYRTVILLFLIILADSADAQSGKVIYDRIESPSLEGNLLKDPATKQMVIYLPPGYDEDEMLYPVAYYLNGYTANHTMWTNFFSIHHVMDNLIRQGKIREMIIVMPDGFNSYGGCMYTNSSVAGNYEDYITQDVVKFIDSKYRTLPQSASRAIGGGSMGGYGAMKLAMKHPEVYCAVASHSGVLSLSRRKDAFRTNPNYMLYGYPVYRAWAMALTPNPGSRQLYDYPADDKGNLIDEIWQRWLEHDPLTMIRDYIGNLEQLSGIYFDQGRSDDIVEVEQARDFHQALTDAGIPHVYEEYDGGHTDQWTSRLYIALPFLSDLLSYEMLTNVEPSGKLSTVWGDIKQTGR